MNPNEWHRWFAWYPVKACGRWRWLQFVERCLVRKPLYGDARLYNMQRFDQHWIYRAGEAHDYPDDDGIPTHFYEYTCRHCGTKFTI